MPAGRSPEQLFQAFHLSGDLAALTLLFDEVAPELLPLALRLTGRRHDAEDLVQETFLAALARQADCDAARPLRPWLVGILVHEARRLRRERARVLEPDRLAPRSVPEPYEHAVESELREAVEHSLDGLPPRYSTVVSLHLFEGLAPREMSARLGIDAELVRTHLSRGLERLRRSLPAPTDAAWSAGELGLVLSAMRGHVLERARSLPVHATAAAGGGVLALALAVGGSLLTVALVTAGALFLAPEPGPSTALTRPVEPHTVLAQPDALEKQPELEAASADARSPAGEPAAAAAVASGFVHGILQMPDGSPARGAQVTLQGSPANSELVQRYGVPADWKDPAPLVTGSDGRFEFRLDPPRAFQWSLIARLPGYVYVPFRWSEWTGEVDLGTARFEAACSVIGTVVRKDGRSLGDGWGVQATPIAQPPGMRAGFVNAHTTVAATDGRFRIDGLPAGMNRVVLYPPSGPQASRTEVQLSPGAPAEVSFVYDGPAPERRIRVSLTHRWFPTVPMDDLQAVLIDRDGKRRAPSEGPTKSSLSLAFDDLDPGEYSVEVRHPGFELATATGLHPGETARIALIGASSLRFSALDPDGKALDHYQLDLSIGTRHFPNGFRLASTEELSPPDRRFDGLPAGVACQLALTAPGHPMERIDLPALTAGETRTIALRLRGVVALSARVLATDGKTPIEGVQLELTRGKIAGSPFEKGTRVSLNGVDCPARDAVARTGADGRVGFPGLAPDSWTIRARWSGWFDTDTTVDLADPAQAEVRIVQPAHAWIRGKILVAEGERADAQPLQVWPDLWTTRDPSHDFLPPEGSIASDGSFRWGPFQPGAVQVFLGHPASDEMGEYMELAKVVKLELAPDEEKEVTLDLRGMATAYLTLTVSAGGERVAHASAQTVDVDQKTYGVSDSALGDANGIVKLAFAPGSKKRVALRGPGWAWFVPEEFSLAPGEKLERSIEVPLVQARLLLVDASTREPLRNAPVAWSMQLLQQHPDPARPPSTVMTSDTLGTTGAEGELELELPPGTLQLVRRTDKEYFQQTPESARVPLVWTEKGPAETTIALPPR